MTSEYPDNDLDYIMHKSNEIEFRVKLIMSEINKLHKLSQKHLSNDNKDKVHIIIDYMKSDLLEILNFFEDI